MTFLMLSGCMIITKMVIKSYLNYYYCYYYYYYNYYYYY